LPLPSRSQIYPTSAALKCRTRVNPGSDGEREQAESLAPLISTDRTRSQPSRREPLLLPLRHLRFQQRLPAGDLALDEGRKPGGRALVRRSDLDAERGKTLARLILVERLRERRVCLPHDRFRRAPRELECRPGPD